MKTSWEKAHRWYGEIVEEKGHYYHRQVILPKLLELLQLRKESKILDLACGQGVLSRHIPKETRYIGLDASHSFIKEAKKMALSKSHQFYAGDVARPYPFPERDFTHAALILALQNLQQPDEAFKQASAHLVQGGRFFIVMNHPCFRIPRSTHWGIDEEKQVQYRRVDLYMSTKKIPLQVAPSKKEKSPILPSFHYPLSTLSHWLFEKGFHILFMEEWCSDKKSTGKKARMENRARREFPLFLMILAEKK